MNFLPFSGGPEVLRQSSFYTTETYQPVLGTIETQCSWNRDSRIVMNQSNNKHPWLKLDAAGIAICLALTLVVYALGIHPLVTRQSELVQRERDLTERRKEANDMAVALTNLRRELAVVEQSLVESPLRLQAVSAVNHRLALITTLASQQKLQLNEIQPGQPTRGTHYDTVPIAIAGTGRYRTIAAFLNLLHTTFPDTGISAFNITGSRAQPDAPATFRFTLSWYAAPIHHSANR